jgi:ParB family transcriptional regulator, chromosome partitioning protein
MDSIIPNQNNPNKNSNINPSLSSTDNFSSVGFFAPEEPDSEPAQEQEAVEQNFIDPDFETVPEPVQEAEPVDTLEPSEKVSYADSTIQEIEVSQIVPNPYQPRKVFKEEALRELADSIKEHGVIQPVVVTQTDNGYELVVGERRFRASQLAGLTKVPAIVKKTLQDQTKLEVALIENIQRQELNSIEEAQAYQRLMEKFDLTQAEVAVKVGKSRPAVANTLRLLQLPAEIQRGIIEGKIFEGHGRAILTLPDIERQLLMYKKIVDQNMNVRQVEAEVREFARRKKMDAAMPDPKLMAIETELRGKLGTQVKVSRQGRGGKITIDFFSDEDLEDILSRIAEDSKPDSDNYLVV